MPVPNQPHNITLPQPDPALLAALWDALAKPGDVYEARITDSRRGPARLFGTVAGYFSERDAFVQALRQITGRDAAAVYVTLNPVDPKLQARANNRLEMRVKSTASDDNIVARRHFLIDVDPGLPAGISATDAEREATLAKRDAIRAFLDDLGWPDPVCVGMSGNGGSLIYRIDLPNAPTDDAPNAAAESLALVTACLQALGFMFGVADEKAGRPGIDRSVANAARITKVIGTVAAKGDDCPHLGRPWRLATAEFHPDAGVVPRTLLEALAAHARVEDAASERENGRELFGRAADHSERRWTVADLLTRNSIDWNERRRPYGRAYQLEKCLTSSDHLDGASIIENDAGRLGYVCHHNRCQGKAWRDVRAVLGLGDSDPGTRGNGAARAQGAFSASSASSAGGAEAVGPLVPVPPFPVEVFPASIRLMVEEGAAALGVPADLIATPLLAFAGATIGNAHSIELKAGYRQRPILYVAAVAPPGSAKSPAIDLARHPLDVLQKEAYDGYEQALKEYEADLQAWKDAPKESRGEKPHRPALAHLFTTDSTLEALAVMLGASRGVALYRDELVSWVKSCDAYRGGRGGDRQAWLSLWAGAPLKIDRKGAEPIYVPLPCVTVAGGIQPDFLAELADEAGRRDGFTERILWSYPDVAPAGWSEQTVPDETKTAVVRVFRDLRIGVSDRPVRLGGAARELWVAWYDENAVLTAGAAGLAQGVYAKLPNQAARLCLILHCLKYPLRPSQTEVEPRTMADAIELSEYYRAHAHRVLPHFGSPAAARSASVAGRVRRILERGRGAWVSRTLINDRLGGHVPSDEITAVLEALMAAGLAERRWVSTAGRQAEEWRFAETAEEAEEAEKGAAPPSGPNARPELPCWSCHSDAWRERSISKGGGWLCGVCHPSVGGSEVA